MHIVALINIKVDFCVNNAIISVITAQINHALMFSNVNCMAFQPTETAQNIDTVAICVFVRFCRIISTAAHSCLLKIIKCHDRREVLNDGFVTKRFK